MVSLVAVLPYMPMLKLYHEGQGISRESMLYVSGRFVTMSLHGFSFLSAQKMASPNGRCATFTNEADGYVPSEGAVALVLKTRIAAERDGNTILAVVKSAVVQHNGRTQGLAAPSTKAQTNLQRQLLQQAELRPSDIE